jgi:tetratricopeptide (TPR) repeat protein
MTGFAARARYRRQPFPAKPTGCSALMAVTAMLVGLLGGPACAQPASAPIPPSNSSLDAPLFYQLLIGEMELRSGRAGSAYEIILDAARRQADDALYERAVEVALQARAGDQALAAARAWRGAKPRNPAPLRYETQILLALGQADAAADTVKAWLALLPADQRAGLIAGLPRLLQRLPDSRQALGLVERLTEPYRQAAETRTAVRLARARAHLQAGELSAALALAESVSRDDPAAPGTPLLGLELMAKLPAAEALVTGYLSRRDPEPAVRMAYVRALTQVQRYVDAGQQLERLTTERPQLPEPWLMLGALQVELKQPRPAEAALQRYVALLEAGDAPRPAEAAPAADDDDGAEPSSARAAGLTQAWLLLAQAAEQRGDLPAAEAWLARVDNPERLLEVQTRRATLLARQGRVAQARALVQAVPERTADDGRAKVLAEAQVLREVKQWRQAAEVLAAGLQRLPEDIDLMYELSMVEEKLGRFDDMERLLRRVIGLKPDHPHAHNALGYSLADRNLRLSEARALIEQALKLSPADPFITDSLGWVEFRMGRRDEALRLLRQAYAARPDTEIAAHLGEVLWASGQRDEARRIWQEGRGRDADNEVLRETLARLKVGNL